MGKLSLYILAGIMFVWTQVCAQQKYPSFTTWNSKLTVDADLSDWGDSLSYYFEDQGIHYEIANDRQFLYVACRIPDRGQQIQALLHGITITINASGKKKSGPQLIFPLPDQAALRAIPSDGTPPQDIRLTAIESIRAIYVNEFRNIVNGPISLQNNFGISASAKIDSSDALCYEAAIAIDELQLDPTKSFALNLRINKRTQHTYYREDPRRYSRYGYRYGYGSRPEKTTTVRQEPGIWLLLNLTNL